MRSVAFLSFVVESDPLFPLTQPGSALGFLSVARRWCATARLRAQGPTFIYMYVSLACSYVVFIYLYVSHIRCLLGACSIHYMPPSLTWEIPPCLSWSVGAPSTLQVLQ